jgi:hypothetical protein
MSDPIKPSNEDMRAFFHAQLAELREQVRLNTKSSETLLRTDSAMERGAQTTDKLLRELEELKAQSDRNRQRLSTRGVPRTSPEGDLESHHGALEAELISLKKQVAENAERSRANAQVLGALGAAQPPTTNWTSATMLYPKTKASDAYGNLSGDQQALVHAVVQGTLAHLVPKPLRDRVEGLFRLLDVDRSQTLTEDDFRNPSDARQDGILRKVFQDMRDIMDQDNDGRISEAEFLAFFIISALFGGFISGVPRSALSLDSKSSIGEQMIEIHLAFASRFESHVTQIEYMLQQYGIHH